MTPEHRQILLEEACANKFTTGHPLTPTPPLHTQKRQESGCDVDWAPDEAKASPEMSRGDAMICHA